MALIHLKLNILDELNYKIWFYYLTHFIMCQFRFICLSVSTHQVHSVIDQNNVHRVD